MPEEQEEIIDIHNRMWIEMADKLATGEAAIRVSIIVNRGAGRTAELSNVMVPINRVLFHGLEIVAAQRGESLSTAALLALDAGLQGTLSDWFRKQAADARKRVLRL